MSTLSLKQYGFVASKSAFEIDTTKLGSFIMTMLILQIAMKQ